MIGLPWGQMVSVWRGEVRRAKAFSCSKPDMLVQSKVRDCICVCVCVCVCV